MPSGAPRVRARSAIWPALLLAAFVGWAPASSGSETAEVCVRAAGAAGWARAELWPGGRLAGASRCSVGAAARGGRLGVCWRARKKGGTKPWIPISEKPLTFEDSHINGHKPLMDQIRAIKRPSEILSIIRESGGAFDSVHSATCLYEVARRRKSFERDFRDTVSSREFQSLISFMVDWQSKEMVPYTVANVARSLAELSKSDLLFVDLARAVADRVLDFPDRFSSRQMSQIVYSFGVMRIKHTRMLEAVCGVSVWAIGDFDTHSLSNMASGMARLEGTHHPVMTAISKQYQARMQTGTTEAHANLAWSYAKLDCKDDDLMHNLAADMARRPGDLSTFGLCNAIRVLHACARFGIFHEPLMALLVRYCTPERLQKVTKWCIPALLSVISTWPRHDDLASLSKSLEKEAAKRGVEDAEINSDLLHPDSWLEDGYRPLQILR